MGEKQFFPDNQDISKQGVAMKLNKKMIGAAGLTVRFPLDWVSGFSGIRISRIEPI